MSLLFSLHLSLWSATPAGKMMHMHKSSSMKSESSTHSQMDSPHSPLRFHSPLRSDQGDPHETPPFQSAAPSPTKYLGNSKAIVLVDRHTQYTPPVTPGQPQKTPANGLSGKSPSSVVVFNRAIREEPPSSVTRVGPATGAAGGGGGGRSRTVAPVLQRSGKEEMMRKAAIGFRVSEVVLCLISFSVMAADKTQGWSGDSFDRYKEYRYCLSVNIAGFVYSTFQAYDLIYLLATGKHVIRHRLRHHFGFLLDQILAYLLISASSSAATRVDDWQSNWGKDEFTEKASASVGMAFLAFVAFAFSSLISGYNLCTHGG